jgi:hypothetical protein
MALQGLVKLTRQVLVVGHGSHSVTLKNSMTFPRLSRCQQTFFHAQNFLQHFDAPKTNFDSKPGENEKIHVNAF